MTESVLEKAKQIQARSTAPRPARIRIPPAITAELQNLDPLLEPNWSRRVLRLFRELDSAQRRHVFNRHLAPKGIRLDKENNRLLFAGRPSLEDIKPTILAPQLGSVMARLSIALTKLKNVCDVAEYADLLEASIGTINSFETHGKLALQKEKLRVRKAFLDDLVRVTREADLKLSDNYRGLTPDIVKDYLVEVFLKHQMLGYRFRTLTAEELKIHPHPFINGVIAYEAQVRQCDVAATEKHLFLVGPVKNLKMNPFSARRFVTEDLALGKRAVFFNVAAVPLASLKSEKITRHIAWSISRIVTLERQICQDIKELVAGFQQARRDTLQPLLRQELPADGTELEKMVATRLTTYEQLLTYNIIGRLPHAINHTAKTSDDHDYLLFYTRDLLLHLASDIRDFSSQLAASQSRAAEELELRLLSYFSLLEKRKDDLFIPQAQKDPTQKQDARKPLIEIRSTLEEFEPRIAKLENRIQALEQKATQQKSWLVCKLEQLLNSAEKRRKQLDSLYQLNNQAKRKCLVALIRICKTYQELTVFLEFEDIVEVDESIRHYGLSAGAEGVGALPVLLKLWEDASLFDIVEAKLRVTGKPKPLAPV